MERTKLLFGYDQRLDSSNHSTIQNNRNGGAGGVGGSGSKLKHNQNQLSQQQQHQNHQQSSAQNGVSQSTNLSQNNGSTDAVIKQLLDLLKNSPNLTLNRSELLKNLGSSTHQQTLGNNSKSSDLNSILAAILISAGVAQLDDSGSTASLNNLVPNESTVSLTSMTSSNAGAGQTGQLAKSAVDSSVETPTSQTTTGWTLF